MAFAPEFKTLPESIARALLRLPSHLQERIRAVSNKRHRRHSADSPSRVLSDGPVVYWTHHAQRVDENPALDTAIQLAVALDRPLLVYHGLSQRYRYASDRHHLFQLQSARSLTRDYRERGIRYVVHIETRDDASPSLLDLARMACSLVTDDFPGEPTDRWLERLAHLPNLPCIAVDTACVVPMRLVGRAFDRAFAFRDATKKLYAERIDALWPEGKATAKPFSGELPFAPIELESIDLNQLVSRCDIDHGVPPVADTLGGSVEGYRRWNAFVAGPLKQYAAKRNDPLSGVASRMSAYLHYGMVSPMRLAREANSRNAEKYLDELLIWRELAYGFCFYRPEYATVSALPKWALQTLKQHEADPRPALYSWETLSRARTDDPLWNACQESLQRHGELHNNVRMTWGKAFLRWTRTAQEALELLIDLNHRYALDGRDPASYGGILWCLGQFDRPFEPEQPVLGTVRDRPTREHAQRLRLDAYERHARRPISRQAMRVAVIGAGVAGCMCARTLADHGVDVTLIEKSRGPSGRCATRRIWDKVLVDHGAPYLEISDRRWERFVQSWHHDGVVAPWDGVVVQWSDQTSHPCPTQRTRWVGVGGMNAIGKHLSQDLPCKTHARLVNIEEIQNAYRLHLEIGDKQTGLGSETLEPADAVLFAVPGDQLRGLVPTNCSWHDAIPIQTHVPCWTMMALFERRWDLPFDGARCRGNGLSWLGRESSKPDRAADPDAWVIQMDADWSSGCIDGDPREVAERMLEALRDAGLPPWPEIAHQEMHRWRFALTPSRRATACFWDGASRLGACGDWFGSAGMEGALESGRALAGQIMNWMVEHGSAPPRSSATVNQNGYIQRELF
jgi:photolyase PhrII